MTSPPSAAETSLATPSPAVDDGPPGASTELERKYLYPGQFVYSATPMLVTTILGSCVSVCLYDTHVGAGGVNHFLLPHWAGSGRATPRFGNVAISSLIEGLIQLGSRVERMEAKIFGGASVLGNPKASDTIGLGDRNVQVARRLLDEEGIRVVAEDVGGTRGRKLLFQSDNGTVWVKRL